MLITGDASKGGEAKKDMTRAASTSVVPLTFVVYTRRPPSAALTAALIRRGHSVLERTFTAAIHQLLTDLHPDLIVACLDPRDPDDADAMRHLRPLAEDPCLVVLCPVLSEESIEAALELGAVFCLTAQLSPELIAAQADALVRDRLRQAPASRSDRKPSIVHLRDLVIDFDRRRVTRAGRTVDLTRTEFDILGALARNPGRVISASEILTEIGQSIGSEPQARVIVKVHLSHLRQKLDIADRPPYVETIRGVGYLLERRDPPAHDANDAALEPEFSAGLA